MYVKIYVEGGDKLDALCAFYECSMHELVSVLISDEYFRLENIGWLSEESERMTQLLAMERV